MALQDIRYQASQQLVDARGLNSDVGRGLLFVVNKCMVSTRLGAEQTSVLRREVSLIRRSSKYTFLWPTVRDPSKSSVQRRCPQFGGP